jgi:hypothetical protein
MAKGYAKQYTSKPLQASALLAASSLLIYFLSPKTEAILFFGTSVSFSQIKERYTQTIILQLEVTW